MKIIFPDYYDEFKCIASACRHNCCIGWEIDIDDASLARYDVTGGEFGERLKKNIALCPQPHFILDRDERCPFLNGDNLCDIYTCLGEESLCDICADHPRFRNYYSGSTEIGLGLCCEAVVRQLLKKSEPVRFLFSEDNEPAEAADELEKDVIGTKYEVLGLLQDRNIPLDMRLEKAADVCGIDLPMLRPAELAELFKGLERLDEEWSELLEKVRIAERIDFDGFQSYAKSFAHEFEQLAVYFVFRHFGSQIYEGCKSGAIGLAVLSLQMLYTVMAAEYTGSGQPDFERRCDIVRLYSAEIEYSQENIDVLLDIFAN